jgi:serine phosphatase RsbU (regulator of sigma subunit)
VAERPAPPAARAEDGRDDRIAALEREVARQRSLVEASHSLHSTLDLDALLRIILDTSTAAVGAERGTVYLVTEDEREIWSRVVAGSQSLEIRLPLGKGIAGRVAETGETIRIDDAYADSRFDPSTDKRSGFTTRSILCAPIRNRKGHIVGVFQLLNKRGGPFESGDVEYLDALSVHAALAVENARLHRSSLEKERQDREIKVAQEIQRALLPERSDLKVGRFALSGMNELCEDASGDYYGFFEFHDGRTGVAIGDVSGHGLGSALVMAEARALLQAFAKTLDDLPTLMSMLNDFLARDMRAGKFMSMFVAALAPATGDLEWCSAGHNPPMWLRSDGTCTALEGTGPVLGVIPGVTFGRGASVKLATGDALLLYTDGATEAVAPKGEQFGEPRLEEVLRRAAHGPPDAILAAVRSALRTWTGGAPLRDDLTLVAVRAVR